MNIVDNSAILQLRNHTKLRSGSLVKFLISHHQKNLDVVFISSEVIQGFKADPVWGDRLISEPILRGEVQFSSWVQMEVLLITRAGEQDTEREFQRALDALYAQKVRLADGLEPAYVMSR